MDKLGESTPMGEGEGEGEARARTIHAMASR